MLFGVFTTVESDSITIVRTHSIEQFVNYDRVLLVAPIC